MSWLKISDKDGGVYAKEPDNDPEQIVSVAEIEAEIKELQARIDSVRLIEIPKDASDEVKKAIDLYNQQNGIGDKAVLDAELQPKLKLLTELKTL